VASGGVSPGGGCDERALELFERFGKAYLEAAALCMEVEPQRRVELLDPDSFWALVRDASPVMEAYFRGGSVGHGLAQTAASVCRAAESGYLEREAARLARVAEECRSAGPGGRREIPVEAFLLVQLRLEEWKLERFMFKHSLSADRKEVFSHLAMKWALIPHLSYATYILARVGLPGDALVVLLFLRDLDRVDPGMVDFRSSRLAYSVARTPYGSALAVVLDIKGLGTIVDLVDPREDKKLADTILESRGLPHFLAVMALVRGTPWLLWFGSVSVWSVGMPAGECIEILEEPPAEEFAKGVDIVEATHWCLSKLEEAGLPLWGYHRGRRGVEPPAAGGAVP